MDRTNWPWSWEEEVQWKANLEERDYDFLQELIDDAIGESAADSREILGPVREEHSEDAKPEENFVTA